MRREIKFSDAILEAIRQKMSVDPTIYIMGLGVPDPKGIFGTTLGLKEMFGALRVFDMPTSENAVTGIAVGASILGMRPLMTHQRVDFFLLAMDQLINNAAKWHYMFGGQMKCPLVIRLIIGRGWGQGPQHSQSLHGIFAHIPGIKVVMPATPFDAKGLLISSLEDNNPVVFIEHRWLHSTYGNVPAELYKIPIGKARILKYGNDLTIISSSHMTIECLRASKMLENDGISVELIDLRTIKPFDKQTIIDSIVKTGRVLVADDDWRTVGFSSEIVSFICEEVFEYLKCPPVRVALPDRYVPTSWYLAQDYYPNYNGIRSAVLKMFNKKQEQVMYLQDLLTCKNDVPDKEFVGPF